ncbi:MAG: hypothetical protein L0323_24015 [Planctomycetes bacterium]|nr:hypothetical protein [Planctomycetota bacterium]
MPSPEGPPVEGTLVTKRVDPRTIPPVSVSVMIGCALLALTLPQVAQGNPLAKDHTGIRWYLPFRTAREASADQGRLLLIKPVAFGTTPDGGW